MNVNDHGDDGEGGGMMLLEDWGGCGDRNVNG